MLLLSLFAKNEALASGLIEILNFFAHLALIVLTSQQADKMWFFKTYFETMVVLSV